MPSITVGSIRCEAGQKAAGYINAVNRADGTAFGIPVMIVAGNSDGPVLLVDGGIHGDEQEGPLAIATLARELDPNKLRGVTLRDEFPVFCDDARKPRAAAKVWRKRVSEGRIAVQ